MSTAILEHKPLVMDRIVPWNANSLKQLDEAKAIFYSFLRQGYVIVDSKNQVIRRFQPAAEQFKILAEKVSNKNEMKILCDKGDDRITWSRENGRESIEAKKKFEEFLAKNYTAYSVDRKGKKNRKIEEFDVDAEEVIMVPPTAKG